MEKETQKTEVKAWLKNLPNKLTFFRIAVIPFICVLYPWDYRVFNLLCAAIFAVGALTDFFDGYLARKMNSVSKIGEILDPISDKLLVGAALVVMVGGGVLSSWIAVLILSRETAVSGLRLAAAEQGFSVKVSNLGKIKTLLQDLSITLLLTREPDIETIGMMILWLSVGFSYVSAYEYWTKFWERNRDQF
ncbi:MAG: CDP-diacylglycerol--glycerol-3-phosphate 3-phosphatidyltransferase [Bdellovibrionota bacterium]